MLNPSNIEILAGFDHCWQDFCLNNSKRVITASQNRTPNIFGIGISCLVHAAVLAIVLVSFNPQQDEGIGYQTESIDIVIADDETVVPPPIEPQQQAKSTNIDQTNQSDTEQQEKQTLLDDALIHKLQHHDENTELADHLTKAEPTPPAVYKTQTVAAISNSYSAEIAKHLAKHKRFPLTQRNLVLQGTVHIAFEIDEHGQVIDVAVLITSGVATFDDEAKAMIHRAAPFPVDATQVGKKLSFSIPVTYKQGQ
jgi:TonB family protein